MTMLLVVLMPLVISCDRAEPLTEKKAQEIISRFAFKREPIYAEVPQRVWWNAKAPKDDYDEKAVRTLRNLEKAGLLTVKESLGNDGSAEYTSKVTDKGFPILGTAPSYRGPVWRARICEKRYDGIRNFLRHPNEPTVGAAELVWHYDAPTPYYDLFETKINKPLRKPFVSNISFYHQDHQWKFNVTVRKAEAIESKAVPATTTSGASNESR